MRLDGYVFGSTFADDVGGRYRMTASDALDRPNEGWVGLYFGKGTHRPSATVAASIVGVVHACERDYAEAAAQAGPDQLIVQYGYCHYHGGLVLLNAERRGHARVRLVRQAGDRARRAFGDLLTTADAGPPPPPVRALLARFATAFAAGDATAVDQLVDGYDENHPERGAALERWRAFLVGRSGPFAKLRRASAKEAIFFEARATKRQRETGESPAWFACFCTAYDCEGRWPISASDTQIEQQRPYLCLRAFREPTVERTLRLGIGIRPSGRIEPRQPPARQGLSTANLRHPPQKA
ncbi:MAG: hypothetical protein JO013_10815 [Alphaproteobacteria bacterium]|nr:hypothetical protein [Alphaproteobacteria bacterium]